MTKTRKAPASAGKPTMLRAATVRSASFDPEAKTVEVVWTTGAPVQRYDWDGEFTEVLSMEPGSVRLGRLNAGAPFLNTHASWDLEDVIGSVVPDSARIEDGKGIATIVLSGAAADEGTIGKIRDGVVRNISVGYLVHSFTETTENGVTTHTITDWEPMEISAVPIPADPGAQIRSHGRRRRKPTRAAPLPPKPKPVSARVADIKRWAAKASMRNFGAQHIRSGTTSDDFFWLLAERLNDTRKAETMSTKTKDEREFEAGRRAAERIMGRSSKRDEDEPKKDEDKDDDEDDRDETCPTCGQTIEDDEDHNDGDADDTDDDKDRDDDTDDDRKRSLRSGRRVQTSASHNHRVSGRLQERRTASTPPQGGLKLERSEMERGAAAFRKLTGKR